MALSKQEKDAIQKFVFHVTIPILIDFETSAKLQATGTLFRIDKRAFVVTARHIFDGNYDLKRLAYPGNPYRAGLYTFGEFSLWKPKEDNFDVAVMELKSEETIKRLKENWQFLSLDNVAEASLEAEDGACFVSGYPIQFSESEHGWTKGGIATAYTQRIPTTPAEAEEPVVAGLDLFFDYSQDATSIDGQPVKTPELPGLSGASIWELQSVAGVWSPEKATRVVGVQSSYIHSKYIRAKSWMAVAKVLEQADRALADAVRARLGGV